MTKGLIHVYTGAGKGKTTAAFGLAIRAAGHGKKVLILQFLKSRVNSSGEINAIKKTANIKVIKFKDQTTPLFDPKAKIPQLKKSVKEAIALSREKIKSNLYDLVILDEFNALLSKGFATMEDLNSIIKEKPEGLELVFTGRDAPKELIRIADYVTEMTMIKHPYSKGVKARKGIEF